MSTKGFVYVLSNKSMPGVVKVGMSTKVPDERAKELSSDTSTPTPFVVEYYTLFDDMVRAEKIAHRELSSFHHGKEFFKTTVAEAINAIENISIPYTKLYSKKDYDDEIRVIKEKQRIEKEEQKQKYLQDEKVRLEKQKQEKVAKDKNHKQEEWNRNIAEEKSTKQTKLLKSIALSITLLFAGGFIVDASARSVVGEWIGFIIVFAGIGLFFTAFSNDN